MDEVLVILGLRPYCYKPDGGNVEYRGYTLHVVDNAPTDKTVVGSITDHISVNLDNFNIFMDKNGFDSVGSLIGVSVSPVYNKRGKVKSLEVVENR